jgi:hypothetical protein
MSWSSGKDSALALHRAREVLGLDVSRLLVSVNADADRVSMHAVRSELLSLQADRLGLALHRVSLPWPCPNDVYEAAMRDAVEIARADGIDGIVFGLCDAGVTLPTVLLASAAEKAGIPTGVLCTSQVVELAAVASYFKVAGLPVVLVDADRLGGAQALRESATAAGEKIRAALTASAEA